MPYKVFDLSHEINIHAEDYLSDYDRAVCEELDQALQDGYTVKVQVEVSENNPNQPPEQFTRLILWKPASGEMEV